MKNDCPFLKRKKQDPSLTGWGQLVSHAHARGGEGEVELYLKVPIDPWLQMCEASRIARGHATTVTSSGSPPSMSLANFRPVTRVFSASLGWFDAPRHLQPPANTIEPACRYLLNTGNDNTKWPLDLPFQSFIFKVRDQKPRCGRHSRLAKRSLYI